MIEKPSPFIICALWIYPGKDRKMRRILQDGLYYFNDSLVISGGRNNEKITINEQKLPNQGHTDYAAEIYYMGKLKHNFKYLNRTRKRLRKVNLGITKDELDRLFLGFYTKPSEFGNRPLSKFRYDLGLDEGVI